MHFVCCITLMSNICKCKISNLLFCAVSNLAYKESEIDVPEFCPVYVILVGDNLTF